MLLAVAFALGLIRAGRVKTFVEGRGFGVLVVHMTVSLLLGWPSEGVILALLVLAFPGA